MGRLVLGLALAVVLAAAVAGCGGGTTGDATSAAPVATPSETASPIGPGTDQGAEVYANDCSGCHGADGNGGGRSIAGEDDVAGIRNVVENGAEGMPGFADSLSAAEIEAVTQHVAGGLQ
jgi:mono/diheme cytochrome c family protein